MVKLHYKEFGTGEPVVILHGLFGMLDNWKSIARSLAKDFWVITVDQRNHGRSPHMEDFNYKLLAKDLSDLLSFLWIPRAHIVGHSMGGKTAMQAAMDYPDLFDKLVVVDILPTHAQGGHQEIFKAIRDIDLSQIDTRGDAEEALMVRINDLPIVRFLLKNLVRTKSRGFAWKANFNLLFEKYDEITRPLNIIDSIDIETLFIGGAASNYIQPNEWEKVKVKFPNSRLAMIPDAGHWVHAEQPEKFIKILTTFLNE